MVAYSSRFLGTCWPDAAIGEKRESMNRVIMDLAIEQVKQMFPPTERVCALCRKNEVAHTEEEMIEIKGIPTKVGLPTCQNCFVNLQIVIGEISCEY